ncbi:MAG TPA: hypothetical protein VFN18_03530 [Solirubrobacterales bacterium]|nr:hypothetical protein [Solirubrobacterales bacterium]
MEAAKNFNEVPIWNFTPLLKSHHPANKLKVGEEISGTLAVLEGLTDPCCDALDCLCPFMLGRRSQLDLYRMTIASDDNMNGSIASWLWVLDVVIYPNDVPVPADTAQDSGHLRGAPREDRSTPRNVLHLREPHRGKPRQLVEDLRHPLEPLTNDNPPRLPLDELTKANRGLFQRVLEARSVAAEDVNSAGELVLIDSGILLAVRIKFPPSPKEFPCAVNLGA